MAPFPMELLKGRGGMAYRTCGSLGIRAHLFQGARLVIVQAIAQAHGPHKTAVVRVLLHISGAG